MTWPQSFTSLAEQLPKNCRKQLQFNSKPKSSCSVPRDTQTRVSKNVRVYACLVDLRTFILAYYFIYIRYSLCDTGREL